MEENLGMVMVFTVVSSAIEWLGSKCEELKERRETEERERKDREEEAERVRENLLSSFSKDCQFAIIGQTKKDWSQQLNLKVKVLFGLYSSQPFKKAPT